MPKRARHGASDSDRTTLRLLVVGDVHDRIDRLQQLVSELAEDAEEPIDAVLLDGDLANVPKPDSSNPDDSTPWLPGISEQLSTLDEFMLGVHKRSGSVYYVPGNHDPPQLFDAVATEHATERYPDLRRGRNVHAAAVRLAPNLYVAGFGGSTPARRGDEQVWSGFPYSTEAEAGAVLDQDLTTAISSAVDNPQVDQLLLLTHVGPDGSGTARVWRDITLDPIESGSRALSNHVRQPSSQQSVVALVHGHTHAGGGRGHVGLVPVFNPGPLKDGEYALLTLEQSVDGGAHGSRRDAGTEHLGEAGTKKPLRWRVRQYELRRLAGSLADATVSS